MTIKESLEHQGISDSLELSLKFLFHTMSSMSVNYLQLGKKTRKDIQERSVCIHIDF